MLNKQGGIISISKFQIFSYLFFECHFLVTFLKLRNKEKKKVHMVKSFRCGPGWESSHRTNW